MCECTIYNSNLVRGSSNFDMSLFIEQVRTTSVGDWSCYKTATCAREYTFKSACFVC